MEAGPTTWEPEPRECVSGTVGAGLPGEEGCGDPGWAGWAFCWGWVSQQGVRPLLWIRGPSAPVSGGSRRQERPEALGGNSQR